MDHFIKKGWADGVYKTGGEYGAVEEIYWVVITGFFVIIGIVF
jgi:hypothetical protein